MDEATTNPPATMRQLLTRWAEAEPGKFNKGYLALINDLDIETETVLMRIQWATQAAIIERNWGLELDYYPGNDGWRATIKPDPRWTTGGSLNPAEALLSAYLKALEANQ